MKIGIICAMEEEIRLLVAKMTNKQEKQIAGKPYYTGQLCQHDVVLTESGIGKVQAAIATTILLAVEKVDMIVNTGSAGGIGPDLHIGDVVIADGVAYHDVDVTAFDHLPGQLPDQPQIFETDPQLVKQIKQAAQAVGLHPHVGLIVSGDQFIASRAKIKDILQVYPDALAAEMESTAIGQVATQFKKPFVIIRAMSDVGDDEANVNFDEFVVTAGRKSAQMLLTFLHALN
ncbi:MAG: 5'-methylthioadenosine/adenosylhomocysteine nucleosidase [Candidatus Paralactobacillus gallistercoris]|uniref:adenosylhomocysteine nucleosidase n=1 Tax=Candidatus Paralactobacillus gallistercoris TaxID=2838724 RepID=A0A948X1I5_9LACO|nr:5'-methylthioadenosine/adenosylhomocysteine nucleosidase [Candidatus Paralactobacillus gallistercoris]